MCRADNNTMSLLPLTNETKAIIVIQHFCTETQGTDLSIVTILQTSAELDRKLGSSVTTYSFVYWSNQGRNPPGLPSAIVHHNSLLICDPQPPSPRLDMFNLSISFSSSSFVEVSMDRLHGPDE